METYSRCYNEEIIVPENKHTPFIFNAEMIKYDGKKPKNGKLFYEGKVFFTNEGYLVKIIEYLGKMVKIKFVYNGFEMIVAKSAIFIGNIKNPFHPNIHYGYIGVGPYVTVNYRYLYQKWLNMLSRVNPTKEEYEKNYKNLIAYKNVSICKEWLNFQFFAKWASEYLSKLNPYENYELDKDLLQMYQEEKIYSPSTCCLIPGSLNSLLSKFRNKSVNGTPLGVRSHGNKFQVNVGDNRQTNYLGNFDTIEEAYEVYKKVKIESIRKYAEYYYSINAITTDVYNILINLEINPFY